MKKVTLSHPALVMWLLVIAFYGLPVQGLVQFKFNTPGLAISEGGVLPNMLSILKIGENEMDITFQVRVMSGTAMDGTDYMSNSADPYVFTSSTRQLPIRTQLVGDRAGEPIETFMICLPEAQVLQPMGAEAVEPMCVTITIVDDDSVVIGFKKSFEAVMEGGTNRICAEVKSEGLRLDPFDRVPLTIRTNPASSEAQLSTNSLVFEMSINEKCASVSVTDNDNMEGSRSYQLILERNGGSTVPVELYPSNIPIIVIDNDGPDANFSIISSMPSFMIQEGDRIDNIRIQKSGNTVLSYNVSLMVMPLTDSARPEDVVITKSLLFNPSTTTMNVGPIKIRSDSLSERRKEFNISIGSIEPVNYNISGIRTAMQGDPVKIIAYDNDYEVGFADYNSNIKLAEGERKTICVKILGLQPNDVYPTTNIQLLISTSNTSAGCLELGVNQIVLNSVNISRCFMVTVPNDNKRCDGTSIQLTRIGSSNTDNTIILQGGSINITLQDRPTSDNGVAIALGIFIPLLCIISASVIVIVTFFILRRMKAQPEPIWVEGKSLEKNSTETENRVIDSSPSAPPPYSAVYNVSISPTTAPEINQEDMIVKADSEAVPQYDDFSDQIRDEKSIEGYYHQPSETHQSETDGSSSLADPQNDSELSTSTNTAGNNTTNSGTGNDISQSGKDETNAIYQ